MPATLPRLAFGEARATRDGGVAGLLAAQRVAHRSLVMYEPVGSSLEFGQKSAVVTIGGLRLAASAHTPVRVAVEASDDLTLMVLFAGWSTAVIEGRSHRWHAGHSAMFLPGVPRHGETSLRSTLAISMEAARLEQAVCSVAGANALDVMRPLLSAPQLMPLVRGNFLFVSAVQKICGLIDSCHAQPGLLAMLGVDDMMYRAVAMLLLPDAVLVDAQASPAETPASPRPLDHACDYILAHLFAPIRLENLEVASGLKARALQMAFLKHHGRTPRQWILDRRLDAARARLAEPQADQTVLSVALECGFTRISSFSRAYKSRFGELPSATVARRC